MTDSGPSPVDYAERMFHEAVLCLRNGDERRYRLVRGQILTSSLGEQAVDVAMLVLLEKGVQRAWNANWQPAELVRAVRRTFDATAALIVTDAAAGLSRAFTAEQVDPRWQAQLDELNAVAWWSDDFAYAREFVTTHRLDRGELVDYVAMLVELFLRLPQLELVVPAPGAAPPRRVPRQARPGDGQERQLDRIRALLAKAESTTFEEEAEAFTAKAQELMARHSIDAARLAAAEGGTDGPAVLRIPVDNPYELPKCLLLQAVAEANRCHAVFMKEWGLSTVVGFEADLEAVELLFTSLLVQATRAMTGTGPRADRYGRNNTRSFRHSFLTAYAQRVGERLTQATEQVDAEVVAGTDLVPLLAARAEAVDAAFEALFPERTGRSATVSNREGWDAGLAAADRAELTMRQRLPR
ncbi:hypothetical protein Cs7R123_40200 [Catellatospora sp. TT07R-123]|uniref:DUF2786 domain-containing protein n=1 Tax=Catellatospora sp. TT07R-123 TaxID=2733863 RepID=UPI001B1FB444|nr:DUF2786 domain-containing protein [Catellatospora sp. TT07R-123]GHJ46678.1 hypothetical protein Cs7R123_40200 [Catellatospora sp. TT07R-123]